MKKYNYFNFLKGEQVTIREILEERESQKEEMTTFTIALNESEEEVKICIETKNAFLIKPNTTLFYAAEDDDAKGYTLWKNGFGPFGVVLP